MNQSVPSVYKNTEPYGDSMYAVLLPSIVWDAEGLIVIKFVADAFPLSSLIIKTVPVTKLVASNDISVGTEVTPSI